MVSRAHLLGGWLLAACAGLGAWAPPAHAAAPLMIWPVDPMMAGGQRAVALWIENRGEEPVSVQVRVMGWTQDQGDDRFDAQKDVIPSPPIADIAPGARQLVRLMALVPASPLSEDAYRVIVDELPRPVAAAPQAEGSAAAAAALAPAPAPAPAPALGVQLQVRYAIPLFVYGAGAAGPRMSATALAALNGEPVQPLDADLSWRITSDGGSHRLVLRNTGRAHARLTAVSWQAADAARETPINPGLLGYVLPGSERQWELPAPPAGPLLLKATVNGRPALVRHAAP